MLGQRYQLRQRIGVGAMGIVYEAAPVDADDVVAIKVLQQHLMDDEAVLARFRREAHATARLIHPHLVQVKDFQCNEDEPPFMVMELLRGQTLRLVLKEQGPLPVARAATLALQTLSALDTAHKAGVIHRDIKPDNLFIVTGDQVKVLDFGVARLLHEDDAQSVGAEAGAWVGTPSFMPPEQVRCLPVDARGDVYALGACLFQMVTGKQPIDVADTVALFSAIIERVPPLASELRPDVPEDFARLIARALHKDPAERFATAEEMADALRPWAQVEKAPTLRLVERPPEPEPVPAPAAMGLYDEDDEVTQFDPAPLDSQVSAEPEPKPAPAPVPAPPVQRRSPWRDNLLVVGATLVGIVVGVALGL
ncbi:serine/threonine protein kinase [Myxococcus sp. K38C18041901]|uniref:serine/threonine-protein kinase n=1 Tax=Myxococcus guangdongensis TaxID=2906760 RepID=UPI0020A7B5CE|nr:serine/threonine-protein kinase [Myxococcus guangdongensis]MCP3065028.1 serine/threonine protein kinase [Myxococcus guangdongensis]